MPSPTGPRGQSVPFSPEGYVWPTSLKKGLFPILVRVKYCLPPMTTFTSGLRLLPMSWRASNTFTWTYRQQNETPMLGTCAPLPSQGLSLKEPKRVMRNIYCAQMEGEPTGRRLAGAGSACLETSLGMALALFLSGNCHLCCFALFI